MDSVRIILLQHLQKPCYDFSFRPPLKPKRGVGGTRAIAYSINCITVSACISYLKASSSLRWHGSRIRDLGFQTVQRKLQHGIVHWQSSKSCVGDPQECERWKPNHVERPWFIPVNAKPTWPWSNPVKCSTHLNSSQVAQVFQEILGQFIQSINTYKTRLTFCRRYFLTQIIRPQCIVQFAMHQMQTTLAKPRSPLDWKFGCRRCCFPFPFFILSSNCLPLFKLSCPFYFVFLLFCFFIDCSFCGCFLNHFK